MTGITESSTFAAVVNSYDTTDPVLGGITGESNDPIIALVNRTRYLYDRINGYDDVSVVTGATTIGTSFLRKLIYVNVSANVTLSLTKTTNLINGQRFSFIVKTTGTKAVRINPDTSGTPDVIINLPSPFTALWLHDGEQINLVKIASNAWWLEDVRSNLAMVGNDALVRRQPKNTFIANGTGSLLRADTPRLWDVVNASSATVSEATWLATNVNFRCLFTPGDNSTTFRLPDMRSISWKGLDLSRGLSTGRLGTVPGSYEGDQVGQYTDTSGNESGGTSIVGLSYQNGSAPFRTMTRNAGKETLTKTAGLIPVIYY